MNARPLFVSLVSLYLLSKYQPIYVSLYQGRHVEVPERKHPSATLAGFRQPGRRVKQPTHPRRSRSVMVGSVQAQGARNELVDMRLHAK